MDTFLQENPVPPVPVSVSRLSAGAWLRHFRTMPCGHYRSRFPVMLLRNPSGHQAARKRRVHQHSSNIFTLTGMTSGRLKIFE
ncbi:MAG: hypothetical protein ACYDEZ_08715, partial [Methanoregula sp.]